LFLTSIPLAIAWSTNNDAGATADSASGVAATSATDASSARAAIEAANGRFKAAYLRGDTVAIADNYTDDVIVMPQGSPAVRGRDAVRTYMAPEVSRAPSEVKEFNTTTEDVMVAGDLAVETGTFEFVPRSTTAATEKGKYVTVWKRQADGSWKIVRDVYNANAAPPRP
jgi:uncharacterized protein (TIGR02246 family)